MAQFRLQQALVLAQLLLDRLGVFLNALGYFLVRLLNSGRSDIGSCVQAVSDSL
jgi:hypothetical protein